MVRYGGNPSATLQALANRPREEDWGSKLLNIALGAGAGFLTGGGSIPALLAGQMPSQAALLSAALGGTQGTQAPGGIKGAGQAVAGGIQSGIGTKARDAATAAATQKAEQAKMGQIIDIGKTYDIGGVPPQELYKGLLPEGATLKRKPTDLMSMLQNPVLAPYLSGMLQGGAGMGPTQAPQPQAPQPPAAPAGKKIYMQDPQGKIYEMLPEDNINEYINKGWKKIGGETSSPATNGLDFNLGGKSYA